MSSKKVQKKKAPKAVVPKRRPIIARLLDLERRMTAAESVIGIAGPVGATGPAGPQGSQGETGARGERGSGFWG